MTQDTIQWLKNAVHCLDMNIKGKSIEKLTCNFVVHSNDILWRKMGHLGLEPVK